MNLKDIRTLALDETIGVLRKPKLAERITEQDLLKARKIMTSIVLHIIENPNRDIFLNSIEGKLIMQDAGIKSIKKIDSKVGIYEIETEFGKGQFFDSHRLFQDGKYPKWLVGGYCYSNCDGYVIHSNLNCQVISGIGFLEKPFLHSVILTKSNQVVDFNYNIVISADLYFKLLNFEILAKLASKRILENKELFLSNYKVFGKDIQSWELNFAFDDAMKKIHKEIANSNKKIGVTL